MRFSLQALQIVSPPVNICCTSSSESVTTALVVTSIKQITLDRAGKVLASSPFRPGKPRLMRCL